VVLSWSTDSILPLYLISQYHYIWTKKYLHWKN